MQQRVETVPLRGIQGHQKSIANALSLFKFVSTMYGVLCNMQNPLFMQKLHALFANIDSTNAFKT